MSRERKPVSAYGLVLRRITAYTFVCACALTLRVIVQVIRERKPVSVYGLVLRRITTFRLLNLNPFARTFGGEKLQEKLRPRLESAVAY